MPKANSKVDSRFKLSQFFLVFALVYVGSRAVLSVLFPDQYGPGATEVQAEVLFRPVDATVKGGHHPQLTLHNKTDQALVLPDRCPEPPVRVFFEVGGEWTERTSEETVLPCVPLTEVAPGKRVQVDLGPWKYSLFSDYGQYEVRLDVPGVEEGAEAQTYTARFSMYEPGSLTKIFRTFISKPMLNFLIFVASILPGYNLGFAIIILTLLVKFALFFPTQHALQGQKKLQKLQPKLDEIRTKHKGNPEVMNKEIMKLWKDNGVNPLQSCLPMLVQFPILIGLFYVIRDGSTLALSKHLIYSFHQHLSWNFGTDFLGLNLLLPSKHIMPPLLVALQFFQMKLSFAIAKKKRTNSKDDAKKEPSQQEMQQRMMQYGLPIMIGVFAFQFPAAVSLYWAVSTAFAIGQQLVVNRKELR
ncbi:hypothetical protein COU76_00270 [Candidatus Peregrinibacteria bacterium CG10_big_fil_rev_8_21_14_0_10_49_10]|nr:MAG: hypothetical protein COU76_00270 [Candidatus Peregrinibacteria bacterium CG10_big_fil_rev_8_21_14_0_10_49_10]